MGEREQRIRERAYQLWESEGRPAGRDEAHWFAASDALMLEEVRSQAFRPVDAAEAPPEAVDPAAASEFPVPPDREEPGIPTRPEVDPNVVMEGGEYEPISEIATIRRTLEVPPERRGKGSPAGDREGAMSGAAGRRLRG